MIYLIYLKYLFSGHHNPHPEDWPANSSIQTNSRVKIGNFLLGSSVKEKFTEFKPFTSGERPRVEGIKIYAGVRFFSKEFLKVCFIKSLFPLPANIFFSSIYLKILLFSFCLFKEIFLYSDRPL